MLKFKVPFQCILAGGSGSGKTTLVTRLINESDRLCDKKFDRVIWCHSEENARPSNLLIKTEYVIGVPDEITNLKNENVCVVIDDLMNQYDDVVVKLFTRSSHHRNLTVFYLVQNLFNKSSYSRSISLNTRYFIIFKNPRDISQIGFFARQLCPDNYSEFVRLFKEITDKPYSYLLIDCSQDMPNCFRFRTNIFESKYCEIICEKPSRDTKINGEKVEIESIGEKQVYSVCSCRSGSNIQ